MKQTPDIVWPSGRADALKAVEIAERRLAKARAALADQERLALIRCAKCSVDHPVATQEYIQTHWYVTPSGCTDGDYWRSGEANWVCPSCGFCNRFDNEKDKYITIPNDFYRPELVSAKRWFRKVRDCYCDYSKRPCEACRKAVAA